MPPMVVSEPVLLAVRLAVDCPIGLSLLKQG